MRGTRMRVATLTVRHDEHRCRGYLLKSAFPLTRAPHPTSSSKRSRAPTERVRSTGSEELPWSVFLAGTRQRMTTKPCSVLATSIEIMPRTRMCAERSQHVCRLESAPPDASC